MRKNIFLHILVCFLFLLSFQIKAQHFLSTNGKAIVNENQDTIILRGMGLGGWMIQEGYMLQTAGFANSQHKIRAKIEDLIGETDTDLFYEAWLANHVTKTDIDSLKSWGFNSVRLPMHYNLFTLPIEDEPLAGQNTWLTKGFELTDRLISWCEQNEMYVILDLHAAPGGQGYDEAISDYDPTKPSLWESIANRNKMVALWKKLAERYADEQWVAGYDLLNEPNWDLPGGTALRNLYREVTQSIRSVDTKHILFIEGNWFANDFTGLTPPWDDNIVYAPHKYWSNNDESTMKWVTDMRNDYNVPLYLGESGENSNVWFRDAIRLLEDLGIGWAWWPMKKVESISGPLSIIKSPGYQLLLDYWNGNGIKPSSEFAKTTLMQLTEDIKAENCIFQKDVIDAMFRQIYSNETIPYNTQNIPGVVYASDYDMGVIGEAYYDIESGNYQVSTGNFTPWNTGWSYRNDGVDIETCSDNINSNGFNVGFLDNKEWMQYEVNIEASGVYDIHVRAASGGSGGRMHFAIGDADITPSSFTSPTGGWQKWKTTTIPNVVLDSRDTKLKFFVDQAGFNISSFEFVKSEVDISSLTTEFVAAITKDEYSIQMNANKLIANPMSASPSDFEIFVDGNIIPITEVDIDEDNHRIINFSIDYILKSTDEIKISYSGNQVYANDGTVLNSFTLEDVKNNLEYVHQIPGRIQAEDYDFQIGIELETTTDAGGGQNIGYLDPGDYLDYEININKAGVYNADYRTAAQYGSGRIELQLIDKAGNVSVISTPNFPSTGGWQTWLTTSEQIELPAGRYILRMIITKSPFNMNWIEFSFHSATNDLNNNLFNEMKVFPNPIKDSFIIQTKLKDLQYVQLEILKNDGRVVISKPLAKNLNIQEQILLDKYPKGLYIVLLRFEDGTFYSTKLVKN